MSFSEMYSIQYIFYRHAVGGLVACMSIAQQIYSLLFELFLSFFEFQLVETTLCSFYSSLIQQKDSEQILYAPGAAVFTCRYFLTRQMTISVTVFCQQTNKENYM